MFKEKVETLLNDALSERPDLFLITLEINQEQAIDIVIDGDKGVLVEDCISISRAIEHNLDRDDTDFSLQVSSAGASSPLFLPRQYKKNIGRQIEIKTTNNETYNGTLLEASDKDIQLSWKTREPKPIGKGKVTVTKHKTIEYHNILKAFIKLKF